MFGIGDIIKWLSERALIIAAGFFVLLRLAYQNPDQQQAAIRGFFALFGLNGISVQTSYDLPSVFVWWFILIMIVLAVDTVWIREKAYHSDYFFLEGMDQNVSGIGSKIKRSGEWIWARTEGIKEIPIEGDHVVCNLATHTHRVGNNVIMEGQAVPRTALTFIPLDLKSPIRQRRYGFFGVSKCSAGYISVNELKSHKQFKGEDFHQYIKKEETGVTFETEAFIENIRDLNRDLNMILEFNNGEHDSLTKFLQNTAETGKALLRASGDDSVLDKLLKVK